MLDALPATVSRMTAISENDTARAPYRFNPLPWAIAAGLLLLPLLAMQFTDSVDWTASDFVIMGALLFAACSAYEIGARMSRNHWYRFAVAIAVVSGFLMIWINLAVGIIGSEDNAENLLFGAVLLVAIAGSAVSGFRPEGMFRAFMATAAAQVAVGVYALFAGSPEGVFLSEFFAAMWLVSAGLFRKAAQDR